MPDVNVVLIATKYYVDPKLVQAIIDAEGGHDAFIKAIQCTPKFKEVTDFNQCVNILCQSIIHRMNDFVYGDINRARLFVNYFGNIWAPPDAANDPKGLNKNWIPNVLKLWGK